MWDFFTFLLVAAADAQEKMMRAGAEQEADEEPWEDDYEEECEDSCWGINEGQDHYEDE